MPTNSARSTLTTILAEQGHGILAQPRRVEALLSDLCPDQKRETHLLAGAQGVGVPDQLLASSTVPPPLMRARLQQRLEENLAVTEEAARWAVETWAIALGVLAESEAQTGPSLRNSLRASPPPAPEQRAEQTAPVTPPWQAPPQEQAGAWQTPSQQWQAPPQEQAGAWQTPPQNLPPAWPPPVTGPGGWQVGMNDSGTGATAVLPPQLRGFNVGACFANWIWAIGNQTWIGLLAAIPCVGLVMAIVLGVNGNEWAWQNRRWDSPEQFQATQKVWAVWGWVFLALNIILTIIGLISGAGSNNTSQ